jgi:hypothetical protein
LRDLSTSSPNCSFTTSTQGTPGFAMASMDARNR